MVIFGICACFIFHFANEVCFMTYNYYIKCQVCGKITRIRLQVGHLEEHPIHVACGYCYTSLKGCVKIKQETLGLGFYFENADEAPMVTKADYIVECSGELPTMKPSSEDFGYGDKYIPSPFMRLSHCSRFSEFTRTIASLNDITKQWSQYKRIFGLFERGDKSFLPDELRKVLPKNFGGGNNEIEIARAVHLIEVICFISTLREDIISNNTFINNSIPHLPLEQVYSLIDFLNTHPGYSLKELQSSIYKLYDEFISIYPNIIPAIFLQYCDEGTIDLSTNGTTTSSFDTIRQFSLDTYESLGNLLIIPVALNNITYRYNFSQCAEIDNQSKTLEEYCSFKHKWRRYQYCDNNELYTKELHVIINTNLRNAIGHNDYKYNTVTQEITYLPNPSDRSRKETAYLLEFENEVIHLFQAVTVISEYIYKLSLFELAKKNPSLIPSNFSYSHKNIGRNDLCPCGSGKKYKKCHGKQSDV